MVSVILSIYKKLQPYDLDVMSTVANTKISHFKGVIGLNFSVLITIPFRPTTDYLLTKVFPLKF